MRRRRRSLLWLSILPQAALVCGCRSVTWDFNPLEAVVDAAWDAYLQKDETTAETEERRWREFREQ
jgi:hypothetical protein